MLENNSRKNWNNNQDGHFYSFFIAQYDYKNKDVLKPWENFNALK